MLRALFLLLLIFGNVMASSTTSLACELECEGHQSLENQIESATETASHDSHDGCPEGDCCNHTHGQFFVTGNFNLFISSNLFAVEFLEFSISMPDGFHEIIKPPMIS